MKKISKKLIFLSILIVVLIAGIAGVAIKKDQPLQAKNSRQETQVGPLPQQLDNNVANTLDVRAIPPVIENEVGATPRLYTRNLGEAFSTVAQIPSQVISNPVFPSGWKVTYAYVDKDGENEVTPTTENPGFQWVYVKMTATSADESETRSTIIPVPVTILNNTRNSETLVTQIAIAGTPIGVETKNAKNTRLILYPDEVKGKTTAEICELIQEKMALKAFNMETGKTEGIDATVTTTNVNVEGTPKQYSATITVEWNNTKSTVSRTVTVFGAVLKNTYFGVVQNQEFNLGGTYAGNLFNDWSTTQGAGASTTYGNYAEYEWVANDKGDPTTPPNTYDSSQLGFHVGYLKMTDKLHPNVSMIIKIPMNVKGDGKTALTQVNTSTLGFPAMIQSTGLTNGRLVLLPQELSGKDEEEIRTLIQTKLQPKAWNATNGESVSASVTLTTVKTDASGSYTATVTAVSDGKSFTQSVPVIVFGAAVKSPYYFQVVQGKTMSMGTNGNSIFNYYYNSAGTVATGADYEWVANMDGDPTTPEENTYDTSQLGFRWGYIKITDKENQNLWTVIKIPIIVTPDATKKNAVSSIDSSALGFPSVIQARGLLQNRLMLVPEEIIGKNEEELNQLISQKLQPKAWNLLSGEILPVTVSHTAIKEDGAPGKFTITLRVTLENNKTRSFNVDGIVFGAELKSQYFSVVQDKKFTFNSTYPTEVFSRVGTSGGYGSVSSDGTSYGKFAEYEWVANDKGDPTTPPNTYDSSQLGFHWGYIKMTDKEDSSISTVIPIPMNVTADTSKQIAITKLNTSSLGFPSYIQVTGLTGNKLMLTPKEVAGKSETELQKLVEDKLKPKAWNATNGADVPVSLTTTIKDDTAGNYTATVTAELDGKKWSANDVQILIFGAKIKSPYYFSVVQDAVFNLGTNANSIFNSWTTSAGSGNTTTDSGGATYEWVADLDGSPTEPPNTYDSSKLGYHPGYLKMTDKQNSDLWVIYEVPMNVIGTNGSVNPKLTTYSPAAQTIDGSPTFITYGSSATYNATTSNMYFNPNQIFRKGVDELHDLIAGNIKAWNALTGASVKVEVDIMQELKDEHGDPYEEPMINNERVGQNPGIKIYVGDEKKLYTKNVVVYGVQDSQFFTVPQEGTSLTAVNANSNASNRAFAEYYGTSNGNTLGAAYNYLTYEWVADMAGTPTDPPNQPLVIDSPRFKMGYMKVTLGSNNYFPAFSYVVQVPINVLKDNTFLDDKTAGMQDTANIQNYPSLPLDKIYRQSDFLSDTLSPMDKVIEVLGIEKPDDLKKIVWDTVTGETSEISPDTNVPTKSGEELPIFPIIGYYFKGASGQTVEFPLLAIPVYPDEVIPEDWEFLPSDTKEAYLENPITKARIGFPNHGIVSKLGALNAPFNWVLQDGRGRDFVCSGNPMVDTPFINNQTLFGTTTNPMTGGLRYTTPTKSWETATTSKSSKEIAPVVFMRSPDKKKLRAITAMKATETYFYYDLSILPSLSFRRDLVMMSASHDERQFAMIEDSDTAYDGDRIYALGDNAGFYFQNSLKERLRFKLKDIEGDWLTDFQMYWVYRDGAPGIARTNYFGADFSRPGYEVQNLEPDTPLSNSSHAVYQIGAPPKTVGYHDKLTAGFEIYIGEDVNMLFNTDPHVLNMYDTTTKELPVDYTLSKIPIFEGDSGEGTIYVTYPGHPQEELTKYKGDADGKFTDVWKVDPQKVSELIEGPLLSENEKSHDYFLPMFAKNQKDPYDGLTSEDYALTVRVQRLGATPIGQKVAQGVTWNKTASSIVKDQEFIAGNTITYTYVDAEGKEIPDIADAVDTSKVGLHWVDVKMLDAEMDEYRIIKVPVTVEGEETNVSGDLALYAEDFVTTIPKIENLDEEGIKKLILEESNAKAWLVSDGSSVDGIQVIKTDLTKDSVSDVDYYADLRVTKDGMTANRKIKITIAELGELTVEVPELLEFKEVALPMLQNQKEVPRKQTDWTINVLDTRSSKAKWTLQASLTKDFRWMNGEGNPVDDKKISDILIFKDPATAAVSRFAKNEDGEPIAVDIYQQSDAPFPDLKKINWAAESGLLLDLTQDQANKVEKGKYQAEITFTFADVD